MMGMMKRGKNLLQGHDEDDLKEQLTLKLKKIYVVVSDLLW